MDENSAFILFGWTREQWEIVVDWYNRTFNKHINVDEAAEHDPHKLLAARYTWLLRNYPLHPERRIILEERR